MDMLTIFVTGLFAGGLTCLAVQGGLLASSIAQQEGDEQTDHVVPILAFLVTRLIAYTLLGVLLGSLGSVVQFSLGTRVALQIAVAIFMIGTALNLLQVHPLFRYFVIQPPKFLTRLVKNQSKSKSVFGPALLGAFTVLIPCGATQAMMAYAIATGSPLSGALTMFVFILGTSPLFFLFGYATKKLTGQASMTMNKIAAVAIILIALYNVNGALALSGYSLTPPQATAQDTAPITQATIYFTPTGYTTEPSNITVKAGSLVKLNLVNQNGSGCIQSFTIPKFGIQKVVALGSSAQISFTAPLANGVIPFMCSMGMYRGVINVI